MLTSCPPINSHAHTWKNSLGTDYTFLFTHDSAHSLYYRKYLPDTGCWYTCTSSLVESTLRVLKVLLTHVVSYLLFTYKGEDSIYTPFKEPAI